MSSTWRRVEPPGGGHAYYYNDTTQESVWTVPGSGAGGGAGGGAVATASAATATAVAVQVGNAPGPDVVQLASATTEAELLHAFDAILAAASPPATVAFSTVTSLALQRRREVGEGVWTERVAAAYGGMLREWKRAEAAASAAPPSIDAAGIGRALFMRAVSIDDADSADNADNVGDDTGGGGGETKGEDPPPPHPDTVSCRSRQGRAYLPTTTRPRPVSDGGKMAPTKQRGNGGSGDGPAFSTY